MAVALRALIVAAIAGLFGMLAMPNAGAWIFYVDQRLVSKSPQVGLISFDLPEGRSTGTAFLVSECEILTNFHVVFGPWYVTALRPPSRANVGIFELPDVHLADGGHPMARAVPVAWGDYSGPDRQQRRPGEDWVLLTLDRCLGLQHGHFVLVDPIFSEDAAEPGGLAAIGYSSGRQMIDALCSMVPHPQASAPGAVRHDCASLQGDSGGPILLRGTNRVVAIASGYTSGTGLCAVGSGQLRQRWSSACTNIAVPLSLAVIDRVKAVVYRAQAQRYLLRLGYDAGEFGDIASPKLAAAIRLVQQRAGLAVTGESSYSLTCLLHLRAEWI